MSHNGRFMVTDKATGVVFRVAEMLEPENSDVALKCLARTVDVYALLPTITKKAMHKQVGYWCIDKFHARGHCENCRCSPLNHLRLRRRLAKLFTSSLFMVSRLREHHEHDDSQDPSLHCPSLRPSSQCLGS